MAEERKLKVVTIGGGSSYTPELVEGFVKRYDKLPITELWLVDIEAGRHKQEIMGALAKRMVEKAGIPMKVILSYAFLATGGSFMAALVSLFNLFVSFAIWMPFVIMANKMNIEE